MTSYALLSSATPRIPWEDPADRRRRVLVDGPGWLAETERADADEARAVELDLQRDPLRCAACGEPLRDGRCTGPTHPHPPGLRPSVVGAELRAMREAIGLDVGDLGLSASRVRMVERGLVEDVGGAVRLALVGHLVDAVARLGLPETLPGWDPVLVRQACDIARRQGAAWETLAMSEPARERAA